MNIKIKKLEAESFKKGEEILKSRLNNNYKIVEVNAKRKWFIGPKYYEISYMDFFNQEMATKSQERMFNPEAQGALNTVKEKEAPANNQELKKMAEEIDGFKDMFSRLMKDVNVVIEKADRNSNDILNQVEDILIRNGVTKTIATDIIKEAVVIASRKQKNYTINTIFIAIQEILKNTINTCEGYDLTSVKIIMLVGPTGVGKTTTLAKLASILYAKQKDVGLITLDTYRMGAAAQLKEYGNILDFEVEACSDYDDLESSLLKFMDKDSILIDTTGQNQKAIIVDENLKSMVDLVNPDQLSLVLSATTKTEDLYDCIDKFSFLDVNSIIITKIDETNTLGEVINIAYKYPEKKIVYFTNGQDVPADIENAKSEKIIKSVMGF